MLLHPLLAVPKKGASSILPRRPVKAFPFVPRSVVHSFGWKRCSYNPIVLLQVLTIFHVVSIGDVHLHVFLSLAKTVYPIEEPDPYIRISLAPISPSVV